MAWIKSLEIHVKVKGEKQLHKLSSDLDMCAIACVFTYTSHTINNNIIIIILNNYFNVEV